MSETNGQSESRLDRIAASHVELMTDYGLFVAEQQRAWERHKEWAAEQDREWDRQQERWRRQAEREAALDARIDKLISGIGALAAKVDDAGNGP